MKKIMAIALLSVSLNSYAGGIPVYDAANNMQNVMEISKMIAQLQQLKQMYDVATQQLNAMIGATQGGYTLGQVQQLQRYLPPEYQQLLNAAKYGNSGQILRQFQTADLGSQTEIPIDSFKGSEFSENASLKAKYRAQLEEAYKEVDTNFGGMHELLDQIEASQTLKESQDLGNKATLMVAALQNEGNRLQALISLNEAQKDLVEQRGRSHAITRGLGTMVDLGVTAMSANRNVSYTSDGMPLY